MADKELTPMMRQYQNFKNQYKDKILLFRMGDFYETFGEDAEITSRVLNITLTARDKKVDPTPLAGFPYHALEQYLPKLIKAGYNVAIADQVEDPKLAKGIVKREVVRIVTPGTLTQEKSLDENQNNFLTSIYSDGKKYGLALCDLSTGHFLLTESTSRNQILTELFRINPSEILIKPSQEYNELSDYFINPLEDFKFSLPTAKKILEEQLNVKSLASFGLNPYDNGVIAAGAIIKYLKDTQFRQCDHITKLSYYDLNGEMILDRATIKNLDLVHSQSEIGIKGSLVSILDNTKTNMGSRKLRNWILHPLINLSEIKNRQDYVNEFYTDSTLRENTQLELKNISDLERLTGKIGLNNANARDLLSLANSLKSSLLIIDVISKNIKLKNLIKDLNGDIAHLSDCISLIEKSINDNPPNTITDGDIIKDNYNDDIDKIRYNSKDSREWIKNLEKLERERTGISSLRVKSNKVFGYYIEITNTHKDKIPSNYIRKQTLVNCERYITPELKEKEELVFNAHEKLAQLEYEVFQQIREKILKYLGIIQSIADKIATIDVLANFANIALLNNYIKPILYDFNENNGLIDIKQSRHPVVEKNINEDFINNDIIIDKNNQRLLILTGPNMSGKSTYIRQVAIVILMAQIGSFIPASDAQISIVDRIFTRVGASDDLAGGRSTFLVEMDEAANIINNASQHSLIILDEIGRGTSTYDGVAIAWAISEYIHNNVNARCMFATHYHELLKLEDLLEGVANYNVAVLEKDSKITFLRKIVKGGTDKSYGIFVAEMAGLPEKITTRAKEILNTFEQENMFAVRNSPAIADVKNEKKTSYKQEDENQDQLSFMDSSLSKKIPSVFTEIEQTDIDNITPLESLKLIEKWKRTLQGK